MDKIQYRKLLDVLYHIEAAVKDVKPARFSWWPFWTGGWMFTLALYGEEAIEALNALAWWQNILGGLITWLFWPLFAGAWISDFAQLLKGAT